MNKKDMEKVSTCINNEFDILITSLDKFLELRFKEEMKIYERKAKIKDKIKRLEKELKECNE